EEVLRLVCPGCGKRLRLPPSYHAKRVKCPRCQASLGVLGEVPTVSVVDEPAAGTVPVTLAPTTTTTTPPPKRARAARARSPRPQPRRRPGPGPVVVVLAVVGILAAVLVGAGVLYDAWTNNPDRADNTAHADGPRVNG